MDWEAYVGEVAGCLLGLSARDAEGRELGPGGGYDAVCRATRQLMARGNTVFFIGNGASATMASHVAADLEKNVRVRTEVFTDLALITAVANDIGYDMVYAEPLRRKMVAGDILVAISSSGMSPNVLKAVDAARELGGGVVTLSAMGGENRLRLAGDVNFWVPARTYGLAESAHAAILHYWIDRMIACTRD